MPLKLLSSGLDARTIICALIGAGINMSNTRYRSLYWCIASLLAALACFPAAAQPPSVQHNLPAAVGTLEFQGEANGGIPYDCRFDVGTGTITYTLDRKLRACRALKNPNILQWTGLNSASEIEIVGYKDENQFCRTDRALDFRVVLKARKQPTSSTRLHKLNEILETAHVGQMVDANMQVISVMRRSDLPSHFNYVEKTDCFFLRAADYQP